MVNNEDAHDRYLTLNGLRFHYRDWGPQDAPLLLVLHGLNSHSWDWDFLCTALAGNYHVVALDQRGHGWSDWADDYTWPRFQEDIEALADALGAAHLTLFGYSVSGGIAAVYAANQPQRVVRLVLVDNTPTRTRSLTPEMTQALRELQSTESFADPKELANIWRRVDPRGDIDAIRRSVRNNLKQRLDGRWVPRDDAVSRAAGGRAPSDLYLPAPEERWLMLPRITCPTLLIHAEHSEQFDEEIMERMAATIPDCRLIHLKDSSHRVHWTNPSGLMSDVLPFLGV